MPETLVLGTTAHHVDSYEPSTEGVYPRGRVCGCNTVLSIYNPWPDCWVCHSRRPCWCLDEELSGVECPKHGRRD